MTRKISGTAPVTTLPKGSIDSHMHVYGEQFPGQPGGPPPPADQAGVDMYLQVQKWLGLERVVVVQANAHQADNSCILDALSRLGNRARGVAVVTPQTSEKELYDLDRQGVRGSRIMELGGPVRMQDLLEVNAKTAALGWHNIVQFDGRDMLSYKSDLEKLQGDYVIDHTGKFLEPVAVDDPAFKALLELIDRGNCYVKLAGCYETSKSGPPHYEDLAAMSKALINHAPDRIIWGSNWPHVSLPPEQSPDDAELLDLFCSWIPDHATMKKIFVQNPSKLYGFCGTK